MDWLDGKMLFDIAISIALVVLIVFVVRLLNKHPELEAKLKGDISTLRADAAVAAPVIVSDAEAHLAALRDNAKAELDKWEAALAAVKETK
jgi:membrane-bound acyltransferase YfiQ involved in biofilm formation